MNLQELERFTTAQEVTKPHPGKDEIREKWSLDIVNDILTNGLISGEMQRKKGKKPLLACNTGRLTDRRVFGWPVIPHNDEYVSENVSFGHMAGDITPIGTAVSIKIGDFQWADVIPEFDNLLDFQLNKTLYQGWYSIFPIIAERANKKAIKTFLNDDNTSLDDKFGNSVLIAVSLEDCGRHNMLLQNDKSYYVAMDGPIGKEAFEAILMPEQLYASLSNQVIPTGVPIIPVGNIDRFVCEKICSVPDYEGEIRKKLKSKDCPPLLLHGVRLPTNEDIDQALA